jgi:N6-adenosine-specific RNA methylase IME4
MTLFDMYRCMSLDPPWPERGGGQSKRGADRHYPVMSVSDIISTVERSEPASLLAPDAHCWCWVTDNYLEGGLRLMKALGFRYVRTLVWVKTMGDQGIVAAFSSWLANIDIAHAPNLRALMQGQLSIGLGQYLRGAHELALFGVRGDAMVPPPADRMPSVVFAPKGRHSAKPDAAIEVFEKVSPGPRVEMFARTARPGWTAWGNEAPGNEDDDG